MSTLTGKQVSQTYKELLKVAVSGNTGVTGSLQNIQSGDGTNSALQISTSIIQVAGKFGVSQDASVSGDLQVTGKVCASAAFFSTFNITNVTATNVIADKVCASAFFGDGSNLTNVPTSGDVSVSSLRVTHNASIGGTLICSRCCRI